MAPSLKLIEKRVFVLESLIVDICREEVIRRNKSVTHSPVDINGLIRARPIIGTKSTIYNLVKNGEIPFSKRRNRLYFDLNKVDEWLVSSEIENEKSA